MNATLQVVFEHFHFQSFLATPSPCWAFYYHCNSMAESNISKHTQTGVVIESGFSFTHIIPFVDGKVVLDAVRRVNVGGKLLSNLLKEHISFRQVNVQDCSYLVNSLKEQFCYCSLDPMKGSLHAYLPLAIDLERCRSHPAEKRIAYVLPDYVVSSTGYQLVWQISISINSLSTSLLPISFLERSKSLIETWSTS